MIVTNKSHIAVQAITIIAKKQKAFLSDISRETNISTAYLESIFVELKANAIVKSKRGPNGGYMLTKDPANTRIVDIFEALTNKEKEQKGHCNLLDMFLKDNLENLTIESFL